MVLIITRRQGTLWSPKGHVCALPWFPSISDFGRLGCYMWWVYSANRWAVSCQSGRQTHTKTKHQIISRPQAAAILVGWWNDLGAVAKVGWRGSCYGWLNLLQILLSADGQPIPQDTLLYQFGKEDLLGMCPRICSPPLLLMVAKLDVAEGER